MATPPAGTERPVPLARETDHRIANSLQLAADFLLLQQGRMRDPFARASLIDAAERLVAVGHLHRFLCGLPQGARIDLADFLRELAALIGQSTGLDCRVEAEPVLVSADVAQPLGLTINELAINAAKHAYGRGEAGDLLVAASASCGELTVTVADRGAGLRPGFDLDAAEGFGLGIVKALARQLRARLHVADTAGACFTLRIPIAANEPRSFI